MSDDTSYGRLGFVVFIANVAALAVGVVVAVWYGQRKLPEVVDAAFAEIDESMPDSPMDLVLGGGGGDGGGAYDGMAGMFGGLGPSPSDRDPDADRDFPAESDRDRFLDESEDGD